MRLILNGNINRLFVQSLCMMFFHGEKFPEGEITDNCLSVTVTEGEGSIECTCSLTYDGRSAQGSAVIEQGGESKERALKTAIGQAIYQAGYEITGKKAPWGILTGIRPSRVAAELLEKYSEKEALSILKERYYLSNDKAELVLMVAKNETEIINSYGNDTCSIYISIPFCPTRCTYCSFISYATKKLFDLIPAYLSRLHSDIRKAFEAIRELGLRPVTIYIGGGTPTTLDAKQLDELLRVVKECSAEYEIRELTVESGRPDTVTKDKLEVLKSHGIDRVSVNPQTLNDSVLSAIGRRHTVKDFFDAYALVRESGISVVNTDLIAGLDTDDLDSFKSTVDRIISLEPENITVHSFSVKKSAQILRDDKDIYSKNDDFANLSVSYSYKALTEAGYEPYYMYRQKNTVSNLENVGYAKKGTFGIYNVLMMSDMHTVFGIGAGASTKLVKKCGEKYEISRIFSPKYPYEYLQDNQNRKQEILSFFGRLRQI